MISASLLTRLDAHDRALFTRWVIVERATPVTLQLWRTLTHLGGASATITVCLVSVLVGGTTAQVGHQSLSALLLSHLVVQLVKRSVGRPRPSRTGLVATFVIEPDRFSFPSGHATAAMAVALPYAAAFPVVALPILCLAVAIGISRVCLGVHYVGDVVMGQLIAIATGAAILAV